MTDQRSRFELNGRVLNGDKTSIQPAEEAAWLALVAEKVGSLHYGVVQIVVHDSKVVQVERTERHRFDVSKRP